MSTNGNGQTNGHTHPRATQSATIGKIVEALSKAQGQMGHAQKSATNPAYRSRYADLAECIEAARLPLTDNGLAVIQIPTTDELGNVDLITTLAHVSGEWFESRYPIRPVKPDPQGYGSAITYARRYCLQAIIGQASDDDDANSASGRDTASPRDVQARTPFPPRTNGGARPTPTLAPAAPVIELDPGAVVFDAVTVEPDGTKTPVSKRYHHRPLKDIHRADPSVLPRLLDSPRYRNVIPDHLQQAIRTYLLRLERDRAALAPPQVPPSGDPEGNGPASDMAFELEK